jgi:hypothetical protein
MCHNAAFQMTNTGWRAPGPARSAGPGPPRRPPSARRPYQGVMAAACVCCSGCQCRRGRAARPGGDSHGGMDHAARAGTARAELPRPQHLLTKLSGKVARLSRWLLVLVDNGLLDLLQSPAPTQRTLHIHRQLAETLDVALVDHRKLRRLGGCSGGAMDSCGV